MTIGTDTERSFTYDGAGSILADSRSGTPYAYGYNARNRLETVTVAGSLRASYTYNGLEQLASRVLTNMTPSGTTHFVHDRRGNVIAETDGTGAAGTVKEYIWLPEAEIAPTFGARAQIDRPLAVVDGVNTSPVIYFVHVDHLARPIKMTDAAKAQVWDAVWAPWGSPHAITGPAALDARFPGQWFQLESGLHYNWHRHYDASLGRYTQPDPLGFVDGPSLYGYAGGSPHAYIDPDGRIAWIIVPVIGAAVGLAVDYGISKLEQACSCSSASSAGGPYGYGGLGAAEGLFGPFDSKPRIGIGGGGSSGSRTSVFSSAISKAYQGGAISLPTRNLLRGTGALASRIVPLAGATLLAIDAYELYQCLSK